MLPIIQPFQIKGQYNGQVRPVRPVLSIPPFQFKSQADFNISKDHFCYNAASPAPVCIKISPILQHTFS